MLDSDTGGRIGEYSCVIIAGTELLDSNIPTRGRGELVSVSSTV